MVPMQSIKNNFYVSHTLQRTPNRIKKAHQMLVRLVGSGHSSRVVSGVTASSSPVRINCDRACASSTMHVKWANYDRDSL
jgi:hypothetical protein